ncbi:RNA 2',3'-cyclic phosphodiesterase [Frankia sp. CNm7]|uniref:RNA 2',3'-cyclic phosphodiesterase n=1 Tax=Frankia nepalensis TaxID=1836974 RepID=A0A937RJV9_9ACTN|nr:RNA 2',3'-cyclic phosphodiesterase [Frankia nepalensis]MBL7495383.1 RNA 2',3'-cyclic phosphodiesterase [Frankia nepalensis]MBL7514783.1 RNA 2',3'-cyclic phosphodiesterase [Frankia nepalensis]MBL7520896.1 RNA 2',3'-cyclic phosphodiesterase [Frankia nepalensis]MBL7627728.1 RNA 2',3'-cyclic phosphodiesterase [Frankia nepalensis]
MARLFVAVTPPAEVTRLLAKAVDRVRPSAPWLRWVDEERIHLTLVFLGPVDDALRPELAERLGRVARRHPPVGAQLAGAGSFGNRVLWAGVAGELAPLASGVRRAAGRSGIVDLDPRPLRAHLTLARARDDRRAGRHAAAGADGTRGPADLRPLVAALGELPTVAWTVDRFELMSSVLGPRPRYLVESSWPLTGS